jgi:hypothetical protein
LDATQGEGRGCCARGRISLGEKIELKKEYKLFL